MEGINTTDSLPSSLPSDDMEHGLLDDSNNGTNAFPSMNVLEDQWMIRLKTIQNMACIGAHALSLLAVITVVWWINLLGGLSWKSGHSKLVFNWHPLLMITTFAFMTVGTFAFRVKRIPDKRQSKLLHGVAWAVAATCAFVGLLAVFRSHNDSSSGFIANMYSLHSWIGALVIMSYILQFSSGLLTFGGLWRGVTPLFKANLLVLHYYIGPWIYVLTAATIVLGIQEKEGFVGCSYKVTEADLFPIQHFAEIPLSCRVSHFLGLTVVGMATCTSFAMHDFENRRSFRRN